MSKVARVFGWLLSGLALLGAACVVMIAIENDPKHPGAVSGMLICTLGTGLPGAALVIGTWASARREKEHTRLMGFIRSRDAFSAEELATQLGCPTSEADARIAELIGTGELDMLFHAPSRRYFHRGRLAAQSHLVARCNSCGASVPPEVVLKGETIQCPYCGAAIESPAR